MSDYWPPIITGTAALLGSVIGAGASVWSQLRTRKADRAEKRSCLAHALGAEIEAYIEIVERRGRIRWAEGMVNTLRGGTNLPLRNMLSKKEREDTLFPFAAANLADFGLLGQKTAELARFYAKINAVYLTIHNAEDGFYDSYTPSEKADLIEGELEIWRGAINSGKKLAKELLASE